MGFETKSYKLFQVETKIWTLSLWDLKHDSSLDSISTLGFELCPYGIWNWWTLQVLLQVTEFELCPYGIWNHLGSLLLPPLLQFELCPYGIWNLFVIKFKIYIYEIWTLSLWDLKQAIEYSMLEFDNSFELCPYGIWNKWKPIIWNAPNIWTLSLWDLKQFAPKT